MKRATVTTLAVVWAATASGCVWGDGRDDEDDDVGNSPVTLGVDDSADDPSADPGPLEEPFTEDCVLGEWLDQLDANELPGVPVTIDLQGTQVRLEGATPTVHGMSAPLTISAGSGASLMAFADATVDGLSGTLVVTGSEIVASSGRLVLEELAPTTFEDTAVFVTPSAADDDGTRPDLGPSARPEHQAALDQSWPANVAAEGLEILTYEEAYLVTQTETIPLAGAITVSASSTYWGWETVVGSASIEATWPGDVFIGITPSGGEVRTAQGPTDELPVAILGRAAHLEVGPDHVRTLEDMAVRNAMGSEGALVATEVELRRCEPPTLVLYPYQSRTLRFAYHQTDGLSDATFSDVRFEEPATGVTWDAVLVIDSDVPQAFVGPAQRHPSCTWANGLIEFFDAWADAAQAIGEGLGCVFTLGFVCPGGGSGSSGPSLAPYPAWIEPADLGEFEVQITAPDVGTYETQLRIVGHNYESVVPFTVIVRE